jgi:hypothetical protein
MKILTFPVDITVGMMDRRFLALEKRPGNPMNP